jgi:hypothetical protein
LPATVLPHFFNRENGVSDPLRSPATGTRRLFLGLIFGGGQNIKKKEAFAAARLDVGLFFFYLFFIFSLLF